MPTIGIIANPASGKDIRRLVSYATTIDNREKVNIVKRITLAAQSMGIDRILFMPDTFQIGRTVMSDLARDGLLEAELCVLDMPITASYEDTIRAAELMEAMGAGCCVVLGGDGTSRAAAKGLFLLTLKPILMVANVDEDQLGEELAPIDGVTPIPICAKVEAELSELDAEEAAEYLADLGLQKSGLETLAQAAYRLLGLQSYFTAGEMEVKAWTVRVGAKAPEAAGVIHSDFERGFIKAEVASYEDYVELGGEAGCKNAGKLRIEGKDYVVADGDVMHFRFNV